MPIAENFPEGLKPLGKINHSDGEHYHVMWGPGRVDEAASNDEVKAAYAAKNEELVPLGVSGTMVAVDWDSCVADVHVLKHVRFKFFNGIELKKMFQLKT